VSPLDAWAPKSVFRVDSHFSREYDYLIVGAGYAGLNCVAALMRLSPESSVLVVDSREEVGGCWNSFYNYVHLHQPASVFGVSGQTHRWGLDSNTRLASRHSILDHFQRYAEVVPPSVHFMLGATFLDRTKDQAGLFRVGVALPSGEKQILHTRQLIDARGFNFSTSKDDFKCMPAGKEHPDVIECMPEDLTSAVRGMQGKDCTYVVIGAGKTGCDTALFLEKNIPKKQKVIVIQGSGLYFINRDKVVPPPTGWFARAFSITSCSILAASAAAAVMFSSVSFSAAALVATSLFFVAASLGFLEKSVGITAPDLFLRVVNAYNGSNHLDVLKGMERDGILIRLGNGQPAYSMFGIISPSELHTIEERAELIHGDYFLSCEASGTTKTITLKSGKTLEIKTKHIVLVKCLSNLKSEPGNESPFHKSGHPFQPDGSMKIGCQFGFTGPTAYLLTCMLHRGLLRKVNWTGVSLPPRNDYRVIFYMGIAFLANILETVKVLPLQDMLNCTVTLDKLAPLPQQLASFARVFLSMSNIRAQAKQYCVETQCPPS